MKRRSVEASNLISLQSGIPPFLHDFSARRAFYRQSIETLEEYLIVAQDRIEASILRRTNNWSPDNLTDPDKVLTLQSVDLILPVSLIYEGVTLATRG